MAQRFTFENAFLHFARTDGPRGFIWKYLASYLLLAICIAALGYYLFRPLIDVGFSVFMDAIGAGSEAQAERIVARRLTEIAGWIVSGYVLLLVVGVFFWAAFEAAVQRRYVRDEGFRLGLGGDELRLILLALIWFAVSVGIYILSAFAIGAGTASVIMALDDERLGLLVLLVSVIFVACTWLWVAVRLAPASAMTIRDRRLKFFDAWGASRGRFWSLFGAYIVLAIIIFFASVIAWFVMGTVVVNALMANAHALEQAMDNPVQLVSALMRIDILGPIAAAYLTGLILQGFCGYMWAGPAALAAKTDRRGGGITQAPDVFA